MWCCLIVIIVVSCKARLPQAFTTRYHLLQIFSIKIEEKHSVSRPEIEKMGNLLVSTLIIGKRDELRIKDSSLRIGLPFQTSI